MARKYIIPQTATLAGPELVTPIPFKSYNLAIVKLPFIQPLFESFCIALPFKDKVNGVETLVVQAARTAINEQGRGARDTVTLALPNIRLLTKEERDATEFDAQGELSRAVNKAFGLHGHYVDTRLGLDFEHFLDYGTTPTHIMSVKHPDADPMRRGGSIWHRECDLEHYLLVALERPDAIAKAGALQNAAVLAA